MKYLADILIATYPASEKIWVLTNNGLGVANKTKGLAFCRLTFELLLLGLGRCHIDMEKAYEYGSHGGSNLRPGLGLLQEGCLKRRASEGNPLSG